MSRRTYQDRREAAERWPELAAFLDATVHGDNARRVQDDVDAVIASMSIEKRQSLTREWWNWNATAGAVDDVRFAIEAFDPGIAFDTASHAWGFMNDVYDRLIRSVRSDVGKDWKP